jgi:hypothetical protein
LPVLALLLVSLMMFLLLTLLQLQLLLVLLPLLLLLHRPLFTERSTEHVIRAARTPITRGAHGIAKTLYSVAGKPDGLSSAPRARTGWTLQDENHEPHMFR